jgi:hypothetical protein
MIISSYDLHSDLFGRCYDSFHEIHGLVGDCPVIALGFESRLAQFTESHVGYWYWLDESFENLVDVYDRC